MASEPGSLLAQEALPARRTAQIPRWPLTLVVAGFPLWWLLGLGSLIWIVAAVPMVLWMLRTQDVKVPRGFGVWLLFLLWMCFSVVAVDNFSRTIGFAYRAGTYVALTVVFVYAYNLLRNERPTYILNVLTLFFLGIVVGGYLGLMFPTLVIRTPMSAIMPGFLMSNELVRDMVIIRTTQFNPDAWAYIDPRSSAPFLYTNNWGNAYSLLLPVMVSYCATLWGTRRFAPLSVLVAASVVPAVLTLNRGMFLGLGVAALVLAFRHALRGRLRVLVGIGLLGIVAALVWSVLPVAERLDNRLEASGTNYSRTTVYVETIEAVARSPFFGYGAPRPTESTVVPLGTQGQVWMVLFSHGFVGLLLFMASLGWLVVASLRRTDSIGLALNASLTVLFVQAFYYGLLFQGLLVGFLIAAVALHPQTAQTPLEARRAR